MILLLLIQICEAQVFVGFANETLFIQSDLVNMSNSNILNFFSNEYIAMEFHLKENLMSKKVRQYYENQFSYYDIWIVENKRDNYKIYKITPFFNYKTELIYQFTNKELLCLDIYLFQEKFILDCTNYLVFKISFLEFDFNTNQSSFLNFTFNYDLKSLRKVFFFNDLFIFLIQERDNNIISIYNQTSPSEIYNLNRQNFQLLSLNVKKLMIVGIYALVLTECQKLYKFQLVQNQQPIQICETLEIQDIQEISGVKVLVFTIYHRYKLYNYNQCYEILETFQYPIMFSIIENDNMGIQIKKFDINNLSPTFLQHCNPYNSGKFYYQLQMLLCAQTHSLQQVVLTTAKFQEILISNNFYKSGNDLVIIRSVEPGQIVYIKQDEEFFPILDVQSETVNVQHNKLFYGPNITYTFKAQDVEINIDQLVLINTYDQQCIYQELIQFYEHLTQFQFICQFENRSVIIVQNNTQNGNDIFELQQDDKYIYDLEIILNKEYKILIADHIQLQLINTNTKQISVYKQLNQNTKQLLSFQHREDYECQLLIDQIQCRKGFNQKIGFYLELINIKKLVVDQQVQFIYLSQNNEFLLIVTESYVIIIHLIMADDQVEQFQLVQILQFQNQVRQLYFSQRILYIIHSNQGYLNISKYFEVSPQYFKYLGEVDCLGYLIGNLKENNNGAQDHYFINSEENVIVFQLSKSLQDSLVQVIPNAKFVISRNQQFCLRQNNIVNCYAIVKNQAILRINSDKIKLSQNIPYEVCASNSKSTKCILQNLKLFIWWQKLIIDGYQIQQIKLNEYLIDFNIKQGYIQDFAIIDSNAILLKNLHKVLDYNISILQFQEIQDFLIFNSFDSMMAYDKRMQNLSIIGNLSCKRFIWMENHLICFEKHQTFLFYSCDPQWNCTLQNQANFEGQFIFLRSSGYFVLFRSSIQVMVLQYRPKLYDFRTVFIEGKYSQIELIQYINANDFWLIRATIKQLKIYKFINLQLKSSKTINIKERFTIDNQHYDKNDLIQEILTLRFDQDSITLLFVMQISSHKAYQIGFLNDEITISCLFILFQNKIDALQQTLISLNNDLLFLLINQNTIGVYNVSQNQNFYRNVIFNFKLSLLPKNQVVKKIYHFSNNNEVYIYIQTILQLYIFQVDFNHKIRMLSNKQQILVNLNRMKENIIVKIDIPNQSQSYNYYYLTIIVILIIVYIHIRIHIIKMIE